jgi:hypothetical protein
VLGAANAFQLTSVLPGDGLVTAQQQDRIQ